MVRDLWALRQATLDIRRLNRMLRLREAQGADFVAEIDI